MQKICVEALLHFRSKKIIKQAILRVDDILQHCPKIFDLCFDRQFEDFLVDQDKQFQNTPNSRVRVDIFRFFWTIYSPLPARKD